jgi:ERO1-like protein alpha
MCVCVQWGKSYVMMHERVLMHPERVQNLYFTFLFVLRALTKVCDVSVHILCVTIM